MGEGKAPPAAVPPKELPDPSRILYPCFRARSQAWICGPAMTRITAAQMTATPLKTAKVAGSSKTRMPTVTAVSGSPTPRMEARVEPMRWMARIRVRLEMTAVMTASSRLRASCSQVPMI